MRKGDKGRLWYWLSLLCIASAACLIGYFIGLEKALQQWEASINKANPHFVRKEGKQPASPPEKKTYAIEKPEPIKPSDLEINCSQVAKSVLGFFQHLDEKEYIHQLDMASDTFSVFQGMIRKLSSQPPIPAGEALDTFVIAKNIFYFYRLLDDKEIQLLKEIIQNETDTLELNLDLFYTWFMASNQCPDKNQIRPSMDVLYPYAGYLINSIGGRAYLFRRRVTLRLLLSYYCLLIVHEADKAGKNSYGIDIYPQISMLREEINYHQDLYFQKAYLQKLDDLSNYYLEKR